MATILKGARAAAALDEKTLAAISGLRARGIRPGLGILRVGERPDDLAYERGAIKRCEKLGIAVKSVVLPENVNHHALIAQLQRLNSDSSVHGVLMFRPLPAHIDERAACEALMVSKDVDGITSGRAASLSAGRSDRFAPSPAEAVISILRNYGVQIEGKRAAVVGRSLVIGRPVAMMLMQRNATVTICHSRTEKLAEITRGADIVVAALGRAETLTAEYFSPGQTVIDVGINYSEAKGKLVGDVDFEAVEPIVEAISPVPAGVGSVTTAMLARHVVKAAGGAL